MAIPGIPTRFGFTTTDEKREVYADFENNLRTIEALARKSEVLLILGTVSSNLAKRPLVYWNPKYRGLEMPQGAMDQYDRGVKLVGEQRIEEAKAAFQKSLADSPGPHRATTRINQILRETAAELALPLADVEQRVIAAAPHGLPGIDTASGDGVYYEEFEKYEHLNGLFRDHCHLNVRGNEILLDTFADVLIEELRHRDHKEPVEKNKLDQRE